MRQLLNRLNRLQSDESGQVVAFFVCGILVLFGFFALVLNTGVWYLDRRVAQNQADAAALAGVQELPASNTGQATAKALEWLNKNGAAPESVCAADGDYVHVDQGVVYADRRGGDGQWDTIRVCVRRGGLLFFNEFFELAGVTIGAHAAAGLQESPGFYAIFANCDIEDDPPVLTFPGSIGSVEGHVHSNCDLVVGGQPVHFDGLVTCVDDTPPPSIHPSTTFDNPSSEPECGDPPEPDMPINYIYDRGSGGADKASVTDDDGNSTDCTITFGPGTSNSNTDLKDVPGAWKAPSGGFQELNPGIYCSRGDLTISSSPSGQPFRAACPVPYVPLTCGVTLVSEGKLTISASGGTMSPYWAGYTGGTENPVLLFSWADHDVVSPAVAVSGQHSKWEGIVFAPRGRVEMNGSGSLTPFTLASSIVADTVIMGGSNWELNGITADAEAGPIALIE